MEAYRDQYATLFNNGKKVVVLGVSVDADTMLANWARESSFPVCSGAIRIRRSKALWLHRGKLDTRNLFVIGPDGRITFKQTPVNVLSQQEYADLGKPWLAPSYDTQQQQRTRLDAERGVGASASASDSI